MKQLVNNFLSTHHQMVIATYGDYPWIATVYYSVDDDLNIYFLSNPKTIHCQQIQENKQVAIAVADAPQNLNGKKKGVQIYGWAEQIEGMHKITHAINLWKKTLGVTSDLYTYEGMVKKAIAGRMYKVIPNR